MEFPTDLLIEAALWGVVSMFTVYLVIVAAFVL